jgi:two-component system, NarL family, invasion response regulator UvrY
LIKILLVDDHAVIRMGLRKLLNEIKDFEVVAEADSGEQALELIAEYTVDVVLMAIKMPGIGGLEATRRLLQSNSELKIVVLSAFTEDPYPYHLVHAGAKSYLTKDCGLDEIVEAIIK